MRNLSLKRLKSKSKQKTKKRTQRGGGVRFWKQLFMGRFFGVGGPSRTRTRTRTRSPPKSRSKSKSKSPPTPRKRPGYASKHKVTSEVDLLIGQHRTLTLNLNRVKKLGKKDYEKFVEKLEKENE